MYVGITSKDRVAERLQEHASGRGAAFTNERKAAAILYLHPALHLGVEAYVYAAALAAVGDEKVLVGGHVAGWVQTFPTSRFGKQPQEQIRREFRMVSDRCLICGFDQHKSRRCPQAKKPAHTPASSSQAASTASSSRPVRTRPAVTLPTDDQLYDLWFTGSSPAKRDLNLDLMDDAWLPMMQVLKALGEKSSNNAKRYLSAASDCPRKLWRVGVGATLGVEDRDWKSLKPPGGGVGKRSGYVVRKTFLKKVVLARYRHRLRPHA